MTIRKSLMASVALVAFHAFANAGWKKDDAGNMIVDGEGNPIWVDANGGEKALRADAITSANNEARTYRVAKEKAEGLLEKYKTPDGKMLDPDIAVKAVDTVSKLDLKALIDAGELDKVRDEVAKTFTTKLTDAERLIAERDSQIGNMSIESVFSNSDIVRDRLAVPRDMFIDSFRKNFKYENGKTTAYDRSNNPIYSKKNPGEIADPQEALEILVDLHPQKDSIIKAIPVGGSGNGGNGGNRGGGRVMRRGEFEGLDAASQAKIGQQAAKGEVSIVD